MEKKFTSEEVIDLIGNVEANSHNHNWNTEETFDQLYKHFIAPKPLNAKDRLEQKLVAIEAGYLKRRRSAINQWIEEVIEGPRDGFSKDEIFELFHFIVKGTFTSVDGGKCDGIRMVEEFINGTNHWQTDRETREVVEQAILDDRVEILFQTLEELSYEFNVLLPDVVVEIDEGIRE